MGKLYFRFRIFLLTLALGMAIVPFSNAIYQKWKIIPVDLPQIESDTPIYISLSAKLPWYYTNLPKPEPLIQDRNLSDYESGGIFFNCFEWMKPTDLRECPENFDKGRNFILNHWKAKKRGYIIYQASGKDNGNDIYYFIEPDENGYWHIIERYKRWFPLNDGRTFRWVESEDIHEVKRKSIPKDDNDPLFDNYNRMPGKHYLQFFDKNGEEIDPL